MQHVQQRPGEKREHSGVRIPDAHDLKKKLKERRARRNS